MSVIPADDDNAYWQLSILDGFGFDGLNGNYDSWCADQLHIYNPGRRVTGKGV
jgi:hypothetical protein